MPIAARSCGAQPPARLRRDGKARRGRAGSQATRRRPEAHKPSWKGVGSMLNSRRISVALGAACLCLLAFAPAVLAAAPAAVTVRVEGANATLVPPTEVTTTTEPVIKDGNAAHSCTG